MYAFTTNDNSQGITICSASCRATAGYIEAENLRKIKSNNECEMECCLLWSSLKREARIGEREKKFYSNRQ